jgi:uncharacterized damage-inducible protein DinB
MCDKKHPYTIDQALKSLAASGRRLEQLAGKMGRRAAVRPAPDKWSAKEIVCHLADCELVYGLRYRLILSEPAPTLAAFDQDNWAKSLYGKEALKDGIAMFKALRAANMAMLKSLPPSAWKRSGNHVSYGRMTLRDIVIHIADHDKNHVAQVEARMRS